MTTPKTNTQSTKDDTNMDNHHIIKAVIKLPSREHACAKEGCNVVAFGRDELDESFGTRWMRTKDKDGRPIKSTLRAQSYCRSCRSRNAKALRLAKKAAKAREALHPVKDVLFPGNVPSNIAAHAKFRRGRGFWWAKLISTYGLDQIHAATAQRKDGWSEQVESNLHQWMKRNSGLALDAQSVFLASRGI